jgi:hypothetical protein
MGARSGPPAPPPRTLAGVRIALRALLPIAALGAVLVAWNWPGTAFDEPPASFATFRDGGASFRHPPGWRVVRRSSDAVVLHPADARAGQTTPVIELRRWGAGPRASDRARRSVERLVQPSREGETAYELGVPGSEQSSVSDIVFKTRDGVQHRVSTTFASDAGFLTTLAVRGRVTDGPLDPRDTAASLRLGG